MTSLSPSETITDEGTSSQAARRALRVRHEQRLQRHQEGGRGREGSPRTVKH